MKWHAYLCSALFALLSLFVGSVIINQKNNVFAVSDLTVIYQAGDTIPASTSYFPNVDYSEYNYIYFNFSNPSPSLSYTSTFNVRFYCRYPSDSSNRSVNISLEYTDTYFSLSDIKICFGFYSNPNNTTTLLSDLTITLTDKIPSFGNASGSLSITENGTYDVTNYAQAVVDVPPVVEEGDYHDDLVAINNTIMIVPAVGLVIYFFYAIYKMLLGGKTL